MCHLLSVEAQRHSPEWSCWLVRTSLGGGHSCWRELASCNENTWWNLQRSQLHHWRVQLIKRSQSVIKGNDTYVRSYIYVYIIVMYIPLLRNWPLTWGLSPIWWCHALLYRLSDSLFLHLYVPCVSTSIADMFQSHFLCNLESNRKTQCTVDVSLSLNNTSKVHKAQKQKMNRESEKRETRRDVKISDTRANRREDRERGVQREKEEGHKRWEGT